MSECSPWIKLQCPKYKKEKKCHANIRTGYITLALGSLKAKIGAEMGRGERVQQSLLIFMRCMFDAIFMALVQARQADTWTKDTKGTTFEPTVYTSKV